jgi:hypothetical protein
LPKPVILFINLIRRSLFLTGLFLWTVTSLCAQGPVDPSVDSSGSVKILSASGFYGPTSVSFLLPGGFIAYGFMGMGHNPVAQLDESTKDKIYQNNPDFSTHIDDYLQYAPAAAVYCLNAAGVRGRHRLKDRTLILAMTMVISSGMVTSLKGITQKERPDGSSFHSFPSGHTATAFAGAEFLRMEYKDVSPWYGVAGYAVAATTGALRVFNERHWVSDVVAGAGFGILSAKLSYLIFNAVKSRKKEGRPSSLSGL